MKHRSKDPQKLHPGLQTTQAFLHLRDELKGVKFLAQPLELGHPLAKNLLLYPPSLVRLIESVQKSRHASIHCCRIFFFYFSSLYKANRSSPVGVLSLQAEGLGLEVFIVSRSGKRRREFRRYRTKLGRRTEERRIRIREKVHTTFVA